MQASYLIDTPSGPALVEGDAPKPSPGPGEVLIRVHAAGVTTTELLWYPTLHNKAGEKRVRAIPGHEFSGVVAEAGDGAGLAIGDEVFGMSDWFTDGATAEYCVTVPASLAAKPTGLTHTQAASIPIGALTAWQGLFDHAKLQAGERVLVHGGAGAVGLFAVQFAALHGARVIATASARNIDFVGSLGAHTVLDYERSPFESVAQDMDVVFDTVGGDTLDRSWGVLKPNGRMVTVVSTVENSTDERVKRAFFIVEPNQKQLTDIGKLIEDGRAQTFVDTVFPLSQAPDVYAGRVSRRGRGKSVIQVASAD